MLGAFNIQVSFSHSSFLAALRVLSSINRPLRYSAGQAAAKWIQPFHFACVPGTGFASQR